MKKKDSGDQRAGPCRRRGGDDRGHRHPNPEYPLPRRSHQPPWNPGIRPTHGNQLLLPSAAEDHQPRHHQKGKLESGIQHLHRIPKQKRQESHPQPVGRIHRPPQNPTEIKHGNHHESPLGARLHPGGQTEKKHRGQGQPRPAPPHRARQGQDPQEQTRHHGKILTTDGKQVQGSGLAKTLFQLLSHPVAVSKKHRRNQACRLRILFQSRRGGPDHVGPQGPGHPGQPNPRFRPQDFHLSSLNPKLVVDPAGTKPGLAVELSRIFRPRRKAEIACHLNPVPHLGPPLRDWLDPHQNPARTGLPSLILLDRFHHQFRLEDFFAPIPNPFRRQFRNPTPENRGSPLFSRPRLQRIRSRREGSRSGIKRKDPGHKQPYRRRADLFGPPPSQRGQSHANSDPEDGDRRQK